MSLLVRNAIMPGKDNNYLVGGNLCNAFVLGEIGSIDDFFLVACEPIDESFYPMITGNILDSEGNVLFRLVKNVLSLNPGNCSKIVGDHIGYEIHDSAGELIFKISTKYEYCESIKEECFLTTIEANFYNKNGEILFKAVSGLGDEKIEMSCKAVFGYAGSFGIVQNYNDSEKRIIELALSSQGSIHQKLTGLITDQDIDFEGKYIQNAHLKNCKITIKNGDFYLGTGNNFEDNKFDFIDKAGQIFSIAESLINQKNN